MSSGLYLMICRHLVETHSNDDDGNVPYFPVTAQNLHDGLFALNKHLWNFLFEFPFGSLLLFDKSKTLVITDDKTYYISILV